MIRESGSGVQVGEITPPIPWSPWHPAVSRLALSPRESSELPSCHPAPQAPASPPSRRDPVCPRRLYPGGEQCGKSLTISGSDGRAVSTEEVPGQVSSWVETASY